MTNQIETRPEGKQFAVASSLLLSLTILPHINHLHPSILIFFLAATALKLLRILKFPFIGKTWFIMLVAVVGFTNSAWHYGIPLGRDPGVSFLTVLLALKILESRTRRDTRVTLMLGYFMIITHFLYPASATLTVFLLCIVLTITWLMVQLGHVSPRTFYLHDIRLTGKMVIQALPFALILFFLFPRLAGSLWLLQSPSQNSVTGMSDTLTMGAIANLISSDEPAFTATFSSSSVPPESTRYWRAGVLWLTDGKQWVKGPRLNNIATRQLKESARFNYEIEIQNIDADWLYALDWPVKFPADMQLSADYILHPSASKRIPKTYKVSSSPGRPSQFIDYQQEVQGLQLRPKMITPRLDGFIRELKNDLALQGRTDARAFANSVMEYFNSNGFSYTLRPPLLLSDTPVDEFLFDIQSGFCEHYATTFTTLMRGAGFPTRIVVGYLGGELNPLTRQITVRQSDAHAWAEYWSAGEGWIRADPTTFIAPDRIENAINYGLSLSADGLVRYMLANPGFAGGLLRDIRWVGELIEQQWQQWFTRYDHSRQQLLLGALGLADIAISVIAGIAFVVSFLVLILAAFLFFGREKFKTDQVQRIYQMYCDKLSGRGMVRQDWEGPLDYFQRARQHIPDKQEKLLHITELYTKLRYGAEQSPKTLREFKNAVSELDIRSA